MQVVISGIGSGLSQPDTTERHEKHTWHSTYTDTVWPLEQLKMVVYMGTLPSLAFRGFPTRMEYLYYISCLRYTILVGNPRFLSVLPHSFFCLLSVFYSFFRFMSLFMDRLVGLVVKASASRAEDPGFESRLRRDFFGVESYQ